MADVYDDPVHGLLELPAGTSSTGYENVNKKKQADGSVVYFAKYRPNLNEKHQKILAGRFADARECAIHLATHLKEYPQIPKRPKVHSPPSLHSTPHLSMSFSLTPDVLWLCDVSRLCRASARQSTWRRTRS